MESMATDSGFELNRTARNVGVDGAYYHSLDEDKSYHETSRAGSEIIVAHNISDFDWKITNETKTIHGYLCYKATAEFTPDLGGGEIATAWFAKDLPFQFRSEEHTSELQSRGHLVCRLLLEKKQ